MPFDRPSAQLTISRGTAVALFPKQNSHHDVKSTTNDKLFNQFQTSKGEVLNPYKILEISRSASREEVKKAYYNLSRIYHPDSLHHRRVLPDGCSTLQEVEDHWERIKLSHEILVSKRMRCRYDRCEFFADPGAAVQRSVSNGIRRGIQEVGNSIWSLGSFTVQHIMQDSMTVANNVVEKAKNEFEHNSVANTTPYKNIAEKIVRGWAIANAQSSLQPTDCLANGSAHDFAIHSESSEQNDVLAERAARGFAVAENPDALPRRNEFFNAVENFARGFSFDMPNRHLSKIKLGKEIGGSAGINLGSALQGKAPFFKPSKGRNQPKRHSWDPQAVPKLQ